MLWTYPETGKKRERDYITSITMAKIGISGQNMMENGAKSAGEIDKSLEIGVDDAFVVRCVPHKVQNVLLRDDTENLARSRHQQLCKYRFIDLYASFFHKVSSSEQITFYFAVLVKTNPRNTNDVDGQDTNHARFFLKIFYDSLIDALSGLRIIREWWNTNISRSLDSFILSNYRQIAQIICLKSVPHPPPPCYRISSPYRTCLNPSLRNMSMIVSIGIWSVTVIGAWRI